MTEKKFHELQVGDWVADMHYGVNPLKARFEVVSDIRWDEPRLEAPGRSGYVDVPFFNYLQGFLKGVYNNKMLHVIGFSLNSTLSDPELICGYCYDGRWSGIVVLRAKR